MKSVLGTIAAAALLTAAPFSVQWSQKAAGLSLDRAEARIGRPLTPFSVAGVYRRTYRRAAFYGAAGYGLGAYYGGYGYPAYSYSNYYEPRYSSYYAPQSYTYSSY
jgi:hypothetical protein